MEKEKIVKMVSPEWNRKGLIRLTIVAVVAYIFFGFVCIPARIKGSSMEPTFNNGKVAFCWVPKYLFSQPSYGDIVMVKMAGSRVMLLKRVVAVEGDALEFKNGTLFVNGKAQQEPYIKLPCNWNLPPRNVKPGNLYVIGDNRSMLIHSHKMGQTSLKRIVGGPIW